MTVPDIEVLRKAFEQCQDVDSDSFVIGESRTSGGHNWVSVESSEDNTEWTFVYQFMTANGYYPIEGNNEYAIFATSSDSLLQRNQRTGKFSVEKILTEDDE